MKYLILILILSCSVFDTDGNLRGVAAEQNSKDSIKKHPKYKEALNSLVEDMQPLITIVSTPRWIFNYNEYIDEEQYNAEVKKGGGGVSPKSKSFIETGKYQAKSFFRTHEFPSGGLAGNGMYFFIDPDYLAGRYTNSEYPLGTLLKLPEGTKVFSSQVTKFLSEKTVSLLMEVLEVTMAKSGYQKTSFEHLLSSARGKDAEIIYDAVKKCKIDLFTYKYEYSRFLGISGTSHNTAFVLINEKILNKKNVVIYDKHSLSKYPNVKEIQVLKKMANVSSDTDGNLRSYFWRDEEFGAPVSDDEIQGIKDKYLFKKEELIELKGRYQ